jgi:hypothetical protein
MCYAGHWFWAVEHRNTTTEQARSQLLVTALPAQLMLLHYALNCVLAYNAG